MLSEVEWSHCPNCNRPQRVECPDYVTHPDGDYEHYCFCSACNLEFALDDDGHARRDRELSHQYDAEEIDLRTFERERERNRWRTYPVVYTRKRGG